MLLHNAATGITKCVGHYRDMLRYFKKQPVKRYSLHFSDKIQNFFHSQGKWENVSVP